MPLAIINSMAHSNYMSYYKMDVVALGQMVDMVVVQHYKLDEVLLNQLLLHQLRHRIKRELQNDHYVDSKSYS